MFQGGESVIEYLPSFYEAMAFLLSTSKKIFKFCDIKPVLGSISYYFMKKSYFKFGQLLLGSRWGHVVHFCFQLQALLWNRPTHTLGGLPQTLCCIHRCISYADGEDLVSLVSYIPSASVSFSAWFSKPGGRDLMDTSHLWLSVSCRSMQSSHKLKDKAFLKMA